MDTTRTQGAGGRSYRPVRSLVLIADRTGDRAVDGRGQRFDASRINRWAAADHDGRPIASRRPIRRHGSTCRSPNGLERLSIRTRDDPPFLAPSFLSLVRSMNSASIRSSPQPEEAKDGVRRTARALHRRPRPSLRGRVSHRLHLRRRAEGGYIQTPTSAWTAAPASPCVRSRLSSTKRNSRASGGCTHRSSASSSVPTSPRSGGPGGAHLVGPIAADHPRRRRTRRSLNVESATGSRVPFPRKVRRRPTEAERPRDRCRRHRR